MTKGQKSSKHRLYVLSKSAFQMVLRYCEQRTNSANRLPANAGMLEINDGFHWNLASALSKIQYAGVKDLFAGMMCWDAQRSLLKLCYVRGWQMPLDAFRRRADCTLRLGETA